jgi:hypothetical protein
MYQSFYPTSTVMGGQHLTTYQPDLTPYALAQYAPGPSVVTPGGLQL